MQRANHRQRERHFTGEHLRHPRGAADVLDEVALRQPHLLHAELDRLNGRGQPDGKLSPLVLLDPRRKLLETLAIPRPRVQVALQHLLELLESRVVLIPRSYHPAPRTRCAPFRAESLEMLSG